MKKFSGPIYRVLCTFMLEIVDQLVMQRFQVCPNCKQRTLVIRSVRAPLAMDKTLMLESVPLEVYHRADCVSCGYRRASSPLSPR